MKRKMLSIILTLSMVLAMLPVTVWSAGTEEPAEAATPSDVVEIAETTVEKVQALIDALPSAEDVAAMNMDGQRAAYGRTQSAYDAYMALSGEERGLITGAGMFEELFAFFNGQVMPLAEVPGTEYVDETGEKKTVTAIEVESNSARWDAGWYVVNSAVTISSRIEVSSEVNLILAAGGSLTASGGIHVIGSNSLTIYGQEGKSGSLTATGGDRQAGIGGDEKESSGDITINGDILSDMWYADAVAWASANGIAGGYGNGLFGPDDPITREQLAAMLYRFAQSQGGGLIGDEIFRLDYTDAEGISEYAREAVAWCVMNGILSGYGDGTLRPKGQATRAEAAVMLASFLSRPEEK